MEEILKSLYGNMTMMVGEKIGITITEDDTADLRMKSGMCLIGSIMFERRIQKEEFRTLMLRLWRTSDNITFKELDENLWLTEFSNEGDKRQILEGCPWLFHHNVLVLKKVDESTPPTQMDFTHSLFGFKSMTCPLPAWIEKWATKLVCPWGK
jgi:hypothetical protein